MKMIPSDKDENTLEIQDNSTSAYKNLIIERMSELDLLKSGNIISKKQVEIILGCKFIDEFDWKFRGKYLTLKELIESRGYFITQSGLEAPSFRILETSEMAEYALKKLCKQARNIFKVHHVLKTHDASSLEGRDKKIYDNMLMRSAMLTMANQKILLKNQHFNSDDPLEDCKKLN